MRNLRAWILRLSNLFDKRNTEQDLNNEIQSNLDRDCADACRCCARCVSAGEKGFASRSANGLAL